MKIEKFKKIGKDKYKVYLDNGSTLSLYEDVIIDNNLLVTRKIDEDLITKLERENVNNHLYGSALNYISIRIRSKKEVVEYLIKKQDDNVDKNIVDNVIKRLEKEGYINDYTFAKAYLNDQMLLSNSGPYKIKNNLLKLGVSEEIINEVMEEIDYNILKEKLFNLIEKQIRIKKNGSSKMLKTKLLNYFINLGYDRNMVLDELDKFSIETNIKLLEKEYNKLKCKYEKKYNGKELEYFVINKLLQKGYTLEEIKKIEN